MKIFKMIKGFFLKRSRSYKIMQNVISHVKLLSPTLSNLSFLSGAPLAFERSRRFNGLFDRSNILMISFWAWRGGHFHIASDMDVWLISV